MCVPVYETVNNGRWKTRLVVLLRLSYWTADRGQSVYRVQYFGHWESSVRNPGTGRRVRETTLCCQADQMLEQPEDEIEKPPRRTQENKMAFCGTHSPSKGPLNFLTVCRTMLYTQVDNILGEDTLCSHQILKERAQKSVLLIDKHFSKMLQIHMCSHINSEHALWHISNTHLYKTFI